MSTPTVTFGTAEYNNVSSALIITSIKRGETSQKAQVMDEEGTIVQIDRYGKEKTLQIEATVKGSTAALVVGASLTVDGVAYKIDSVDVTNTNTGHHTCSITASAPGGAIEETAAPTAAPSGSGAGS